MHFTSKGNYEYHYTMAHSLYIRFEAAATGRQVSLAKTCKCSCFWFCCLFYSSEVGHTTKVTSETSDSSPV